MSFVSPEEWERDRTAGDSDYVIIGSSFCAAGFLSQLLKPGNKPNAKIFILERGDYTSPQEFDSLTPTELGKREKASEEIPWTISDRCKEEHIKKARGMNHIFGGRSIYWKAWCPEPTKEEMAGWPNDVIESLHEYFPIAKELLGVQPVNELRDDNGEKIFGRLHDCIFEKLESARPDIKAISRRIEHTPLAVVSSKHKRYGDLQKYSVLEPLSEILEQKENVRAATGCLVTKIRHENGRATILETSRGDFTLGNAKLILAMSTLPSTTLMLNSFSPSSFEQLREIGERFTGHCLTLVCARVPFVNTEKYAMLNEGAPRNPEMASFYIPGENVEVKQDFHIQFNAVAVRDGVPIDAYERVRNLLKSPSEEQLKSSKGHIVMKCATLGQLDHQNPNNWFHLNAPCVDADISCNTTLQVIANEKDHLMWETMDDATFKVLECLASDNGAIEYWNSDSREWQSERPPTEQIRLPYVVHPASTMWLGTEASPVDLDYRFRGVENVYLTGGALWPTGASWNPTCSMTALAMQLADQLSRQ